MPERSVGERETARRLWWVFVFAAAFAWVESAVVVYLRHVYYGGDFHFPIAVTWRDGRVVVDLLGWTELVREAATMFMLVAVGMLAGRSGWERFSFFMIAFGVWDVFYYVWLKVICNWPEGLMTWDLLFLIPLPWVGPVITPVLVSLAMIGAGVVIVVRVNRGFRVETRWFDWCIVLLCALLIVVSFCWDWKNILRVPTPEHRYDGIPRRFAWWLFLPAYCSAVVYVAVRAWVPGFSVFREEGS